MFVVILYKVFKMKYSLIIITLISILGCNAQEVKQETDTIVKYNELTESEKNVIQNKATDAPFSGEYTDKFSNGVYICRQCNNPLYKSDDKFHSNCGWPSFDNEIEGSVTRVTDADGRRTEIICNNCDGHLGHVFLNEGFTEKNTRHCVNTSSLKFIESEEVDNLPTVIRK